MNHRRGPRLNRVPSGVVLGALVFAGAVASAPLVAAAERVPDVKRVPEAKRVPGAERVPEAKRVPGAERVEDARRFLRVAEDDDGSVALEIASREFARPDGTGPVVSLVGVAHIGDALSSYAGSLASGNQENPGSLGLPFREGSMKAAATQVGSGAELLVRVAEGTPAGVRAFHPTGLPDSEGFLAMGCVEILAHGYDAVAGTEAEFDPDNALCQRVLGRLFPWAPQDTPGWLTLLWATGRSELEGQEYLGETWIWHNDLPGEWEGMIPNSSRWIGR